MMSSFFNVNSIKNQLLSLMKWQRTQNYHYKIPNQIQILRAVYQPVGAFILDILWPLTVRETTGIYKQNTRIVQTKKER
jgi:hypothetical protein